MMMSIQQRVKCNEEVVLSLTESSSNDCLVPITETQKIFELIQK